MSPPKMHEDANVRLYWGTSENHKDEEYLVDASVEMGPPEVMAEYSTPSSADIEILAVYKIEQGAFNLVPLDKLAKEDVDSIELALAEHAKDKSIIDTDYYDIYRADHDDPWNDPLPTPEDPYDPYDDYDHWEDGYDDGF